MKYVCPYCKKGFRHEGFWKRHVERTCSKVPREPDPEPVEETFEDPKPVASLNLEEVYGEKAVAVVKSNICPRDPESAELPDAEEFDAILTAVEREKGVKIRK